MAVLLLTAVGAVAQPGTVHASARIARPALAPIPSGAQFDAAGHLDPERATRAYLDTLPADKRAASNKYFEGGYWLILWDAVYTIAVMLLLLFTGASARMRDLAARVTRWRWMHTWLYFAEFFIATAVLSAPLTWYEGFYRQHLYQQSHQAMSGWLRDQLIGGSLALVLGGLLVVVLYALVRRLPNTWHLWGAVVAVAFLAFGALIAPVYIAPLFNTYTRIQDPTVVAPILRMAHANGIGVQDLYQVDASRQTTNVSANVSGLFNTTRITLNDNLLHQASLEEIEAATAHEMGHYVLNHVLKGIMESTIGTFIFFFVLRAWMQSMLRRWGVRWRVTAIDDIAMLPAAIMIITVLGLLSTPITNTMVRTQEYEADMYGLNASRQPDGFAQVVLKLGQYRKLEPTPLEEFIFFDHPSGHTRILAAMRWKSENANTVEHSAGY